MRGASNGVINVMLGGSISLYWFDDASTELLSFVARPFRIVLAFGDHLLIQNFVIVVCNLLTVKIHRK